MNNSPAIKKESSSTDLSLPVNIENLKYLFYMLHGETSTRVRTFKGPVYVTKDDIIQLIDSLISQLEVAHVKTYTINVGVGFDKDIVEKPYNDFKSYVWVEPYPTTEVIIKINFLYKDYDSGNPLKHGMLIRIAKGIKPANFFQIMASSDSDKIDDVGNLMCPIFCRTDHVNDKLSKDLLFVVSEWHAGQKQPRLLSGAYEFIKSHKRAIARCVHYSYSTVMILFLCYIAFQVPSLVSTAYQMSTFVAIIISSKLFVSICLNTGGNRAQKLFVNLSKISGTDVIFNITKGDDKENAEIIDSNKSLFNDARAIFIWTNIQSVFCGIIATIIFEIAKRLL